MANFQLLTLYQTYVFIKNIFSLKNEQLRWEGNQLDIEKVFNNRTLHFFVTSRKFSFYANMSFIFLTLR